MSTLNNLYSEVFRSFRIDTDMMISVDEYYHDFREDSKTYVSNIECQKMCQLYIVVYLQNKS